ncbi:substrate-binding domain-containing protein [Rhodoluna lacicola]|uniref:ABC-type sugar transport system, periplasmic component n=1 Tax=Rhodoluna lacicola TaxID=529884 RepID=A0A060JEB3_9MICO|nr:substrate-binding domain-containing protein [Rhodoluna lacicola]AIC46927.1 ABC-type sugar transport system, periplasmic component [Rhodoluna lacicola]
MKRSKSIAVSLAAISALLLAGCSSPGTEASSSTDSKAIVLDAASLTPNGIIGKGKNGEEPASVDALQLTDEEKAKVKAGKFTAAIAMQTMDIDWSRLTLKGIQDTFDSLGIKVVGVTDAKFDVQQQIADLENLITKKPDVIISIPVDDVATAEAYKKVSAAGIKLIFIHMPASGLKYPADYQAVVAPDNQGNGEIAAAALSKYIPENGVAGIVDFAVDFYTTNQRTLRVKNWFSENRPDVKIKEVGFTDTTAVGPITANFVTANPDVNGLFIIWDSPAMQSVAALRSAGVTLPITTIDLGTEDAVDMAGDGYIKAVGAQRPYDQGVAEALAAANALLGKKVPAWVALPAVAVTPGNLLESYKSIFGTEVPKEIVDACNTSGICGK